MGTRRGVAPVLGALAGVVMAGCASLDSEREPDWQSHFETRPLADTGALDDGTRLVIGNPRQFAVVDGANGETLGVLGEGGRLQVTIAVGDTAAYRLRPDSSNVLTLADAELALVLDYEGTRERITAIDLASGDKAWHRTDYRYSVQQYEETIRRAAAQAGGAIADALGGEAHGEAIDDRRRRQRHFAQHLAVSVDDGGAVLFKTFASLVLLDAQTGGERWRVPAFNGPGILQVEEIDNGDFLVLSTPRNLARLQIAQAYSLMRVGRDGQVRWVSEHAGNATRGMEVVGDRVVVDGTPLEVFDLASGERLWANELRYAAGGFPDPRYIPAPAPLITADGLYQAAFTHGEDGSFVSAGFPHRVRAYDIDSGEERWETAETNTFFGELYEVDERLLVWGAGAFFGAHEGGGIAALDPATGERLWQSPEMATPGTFTTAPWVVEPVFDAEREHVYIAGPEDLYGLRIDDGERTLAVDIEAVDIGAPVGLVRHDDHIVVVAREGVAAFALADGSRAFVIETERIADYSLHGERLVIHVVATVAGLEGDNGAGGVRAINLDHGTAGGLVAWPEIPSLVFGPLGGPRAFVTADGRHAFFVDRDGYLRRYTL